MQTCLSLTSGIDTSTKTKQLRCIPSRKRLNIVLFGKSHSTIPTINQILKVTLRSQEDFAIDISSAQYGYWDFVQIWSS